MSGRGEERLVAPPRHGHAGHDPPQPGTSSRPVPPGPPLTSGELRYLLSFLP